MSKNVNNEVTMNPPIQDYAYPDDHAPAATYYMIGFFSFSRYKEEKQGLYKVMSPMGR